MAQLLHESPPRAALGYYSLLLACPAILLLVLRRLTASSAAARDRERLLSRLPSPPRRLPVIGHLHLLVGRLPHISLRDLAAEHGRDGLMLLRLGAVPTLVVSSPRAAQAVLRTHDQVFASRPYSTVAGIIFYGPSDVGCAPYGEHWRRVKKIATTHLLTSKKVRAYRHAREQEVRLVMAKIRKVAAAGMAVDLSSLLNFFTNDIVCHTVSGKFFKEGRNELFRELIEATSVLLGGFNIDDYFPSLVKLDAIKRIVCAKAQNLNKRWDELISSLVIMKEGRRHNIGTRIATSLTCCSLLRMSTSSQEITSRRNWRSCSQLAQIHHS